MLEIFVNKQRLDLTEDISINLTWESPFLLQDRIPVPNSMSFSLPNTPGNLKAFGNPHRIASTNAKWTDQESKISFNNVSFLNGKLKLSEVGKKLKMNFQGELFPDVVRDRLHDISMEKFSFGTGTSLAPDVNSGWGKDYKDTIFSNAVNKSKFAVCPLRVEKEEWHVPGPGEENYPEGTGGGISSAMRMYFNFFNVATGDYLMENKFHMLIYPQLYVHYLFDYVFGDLLQTNPFRDDAELRNLVATSSFHQKYQSAPGLTWGILLDNVVYQSTERYFILNSVMGAYKFNEFLKAILKVFCCSFIPKTDGKWDILYNKDIIASNNTTDWSNKLTGKHTIENESGKAYLYGFSNIEGDSSEEIEIENISKTINELLSADEGIYEITGTKQVFKKELQDKDEETDPDVFEYKRLRSGLSGQSPDADETYSMISDVGALPMRVDEYWSVRNDDNGIPKSEWYVPEFNGDRDSLDALPLIGFNRGWINTATGTINNPLSYKNHYPFLTSFNLDLAGNRIGNYSLEWEGNYGLINKFHSSFKSYIEKDRKKLIGYFELTELDLKNLDWTQKIHVRGKVFYLNKVETTIKKRRISLSKCELIEV